MKRRFLLTLNNKAFKFEVPVEGDINDLKDAITECTEHGGYILVSVDEIVNLPLEDIYDETSENYQG